MLGCFCTVVVMIVEEVTLVVLFDKCYWYDQIMLLNCRIVLACYRLIAACKHPIAGKVLN